MEERYGANSPRLWAIYAAGGLVEVAAAVGNTGPDGLRVCPRHARERADSDGAGRWPARPRLEDAAQDVRGYPPVVRGPLSLPRAKM